MGQPARITNREGDRNARPRGLIAGNSKNLQVTVEAGNSRSRLALLDQDPQRARPGAQVEHAAARTDPCAGDQPPFESRLRHGDLYKQVVRGCQPVEQQSRAAPASHHLPGVSWLRSLGSVSYMNAATTRPDKKVR